MSEFESYAHHDPEVAADFIEMWEGFRETPYLCPAGKLTVGFGHTGADITEDMRLTYAEARALLIEDIKQRVADLAPWVNVHVTEGMYVALTSLAFNVGAYYVTHKCPKLMRALNLKDWEECSKQFLDITKSNGKELPGLVRRRRAEARLFLGE